MSNIQIGNLTFTHGETISASSRETLPAITIDVTQFFPNGAQREHAQRVCIYGNDLTESSMIRDAFLKSIKDQGRITALIDAGKRLEKAFEALLPGLPNIAMQDYTLLDANHVWKQALKEFQNEQEIQTSPVGESN